MIRRMLIATEVMMRLQPDAIVRVVAEGVPAGAKRVGQGYDALHDAFYIDIESSEFTTDNALAPRLVRVEAEARSRTAEG